MFRTIARSIALLAVLVPLVASARTVPPGVNLHNGYILVINHVQYEDGFSYPGLVRVTGVVSWRVRNTWSNSITLPRPACGSRFG